MSHRSRASKVRQHVHCDSCYNRRCRARVEVSVCCALSSCRLHCGAVFHLCKEEDHMLLCPNVRVPCINAAFGCQVQLPRSSRAAHLQVCPASVVCCTMEWIRWPTDDTNPHYSAALQEKVLEEHEGQGDALDLAMALVDQKELYSRLKMKPLYPELMEVEEEEEEEEEEIKEEEKEETAVGGFVNGFTNKDAKEVPPCPPSSAPAETSSRENKVEETAKNDVSEVLSISLEKHRLFEMMFSMERGACAVAQENLDNPEQNAKLGEQAKDQRQSGQVKSTSAGQKKDREKPDQKSGTPAAASCPPPDTSKTGHAPWQEGVLDRLVQDLTPQEYNMYVVHHGRMLLSFGQIHACTPREKDFVYGSLEPIPVQTLRSFKVPDSYHYRQRVHLYDISARAQSEPRSVDTSDLSTNEEDWFSDEAEATLLGYAEREVMGHKISESKAADGLYVDEGTQTHSFRTSPFKAKTTLADVMVDRPLKLLLQLQDERVSGRHDRATCVFTFLCGHSFHRREFATHFRNVHSDIQTSLSGWFEQRCPLAYLGCTYSQRRFQPSTHKATVSYNQQLRCFNLRPTLEDALCDASQAARSTGGTSSSSATQSKRRGRADEDSLSSLPYEVLCHVASFLDCLSLSQLALVSRLMRQVCSSLLHERGMVTLRWEKKTESRRGTKWMAKPVWEFSHLFSSVDSWRMADIPPISAHLKVCPYYETSPHPERVLLPSMCEKQGGGKEKLSLVNHFTGNRRQK